MSKLTSRLKRLNPKTAVVLMLNAVNRTSFDPDRLVVSEPHEGSALDTTVTISPRRRVHKRDTPIEGDPIDFEFKRLELSSQFQGLLLNWRPKLPISTQDLLDELTKRTGQKFYLEDFILETIDRSNARRYTLKAKQESLRWCGTHDFVLSHETDLGWLVPEALGFDAEEQAVLPPLDSQPAPVDFNRYYGELNVTPWLSTVSTLRVADLAQDVPGLVTLFRRAVSNPQARPYGPELDWVVTNTPAPYNLFNARVTAVRKSVNHPLGLNYTLEVWLDPAYCLTQSGKVIFHYCDPSELKDRWGGVRFTRLTVDSLVDATTYAAKLKTLEIGVVLNAAVLGTARLVAIDDGQDWVVSTTPLPFNLHGAVVVRNERLTSLVERPAAPGITHAMTVALDPVCTNYRGTYTFFYRSAD